MTCEKIEPLLYLKPDERSEKEQQLIREHLEYCESCLLLARKIRESSEMVRQMATVETDVEPDTMVDTFIQRIEEERRQKDWNMNKSNHPVHVAFQVLKWGFSVAALFFSAILVIQVLSWRGNREFVADGQKTEANTQKILMENIPPHPVITRDNMDKWIGMLSLNRSNTLPLEKIIFEKYKQEIMNHAVIKE